MRYACRAGALVHVVDVLRYDIDVVIPFQLGNGVVTGIGLPLEQLAAPFVVEPDDRRAVAYERFGRAYIFDAIVGPQPVRVAERGYAAVGAYACAGKYHYFFHYVRDADGYRSSTSSIFRRNVDVKLHNRRRPSKYRP